MTCRSVTLIAIAAAAWLSALLDLGPAVGRAQEIRINELMSSNGATPADENGDFPDWFELFNPTPDAVSLNGWGVSDDAKRPFKWVFRDAVLESGEHLLLFASGKDRQPARVDSLGPETIPGLRLWLRADAVSADSSTQVRRDGTTVYVRQWRDQSGSGNHAVQTADASQPTWLAAGPTGTPALRFDGVDDQLRLPRPLATNSFSLLAVFRTTRPHETDPEGKTGVGGVAGQRYLFGAQHGGDSNAGAGLSVGTNGVAVYEHGSGYMPALAVFSGPLGPGNVLVGVHYDAKQLSLDVQGLAARAGMASPRVLVTAPVEIGLGAYGAFDGDLAEVLLYDRPLAENERLGLARFLADKYGIAVAQPRHTNFQLSSQGEELQLTRPDASVADSVRFGPIARDISYGRQPDGSNAFVFFREPTPGAPNTTPGATELL
ncbi:MAG TPA: lamin tail domain-containing protein, partial [Verrucomicrobiota bacterium]|nr:lamin tail domain-containing protein [Verrucomicrobiota bacterium]